MSKYVSVRRFAQELGVTRAAVYQWIALRRVLADRVDGRILVRQQELGRVRSNLRDGLPVGVGRSSKLASAK